MLERDWVKRDARCGRTCSADFQEDTARVAASVKSVAVTQHGSVLGRRATAVISRFMLTMPEQVHVKKDVTSEARCQQANAEYLHKRENTQKRKT